MVRTLIMLAVMILAFVAVLRVPRGRWSLTGLVGLLTGLAIAVEVGARFLVLSGSSNNILYNVFIPLEFLLVLLLLYRVRPRWRAFWVAGASVGLLGAGLSYGLGLSNDFLIVEAALLVSLILGIGLMAVLWDLANTSDRSLAQLPSFWLFMGLLLYFGGMTPVLVLIRFIFDQDQALAGRLWQIAPVLCVIRYVFTAFAAVVATRVPNELQHGR